MRLRGQSCTLVRRGVSSGRTTPTPAERFRDVHARTGHDRGSETPAGQVRCVRCLSAGPRGDVRGGTRQVRPRSRWRRGHQALRRQPARHGSTRDALPPLREACVPCTGGDCKCRYSSGGGSAAPATPWPSSQTGAAFVPAAPMAPRAASIIQRLTRLLPSTIGDRHRLRAMTADSPRAC